MMIRSVLAAVLLAAGVFSAAPVHAQEVLSTNTVPLVSFGLGRFDFIDNAEENTAVDFRAEYRFGTPFFYVLKPLMGIEVTSDRGAALFAGIVADWLFQDHWVVAPSFSAGLWADGGGKRMGSAIEFRSQIEAGYRFDNDWRMTGAFSHISNGDTGNKNPGAEQLMAYLHVPADTLFPR